MEGLLDILVIIGLFVLRLAVPAGLTVGVVYLLRRLDTQWEEEAKKLPAVAAAHVVMARAKQPCWEEKGCTEAEKADCPAPHKTAIPCWLARMRADGGLPSVCRECYRYKGFLEPVPEKGKVSAPVPVNREIG